MLCDFGVSTEKCSNTAEFINANEVCVCSYHRLFIDAFTWENRNKRTWRRITKADTSFNARYARLIKQ